MGIFERAMVTGEGETIGGNSIMSYSFPPDIKKTGEGVEGRRVSIHPKMIFCERLSRRIWNPDSGHKLKTSSSKGSGGVCYGTAVVIQPRPERQSLIDTRMSRPGSG